MVNELTTSCLVLQDSSGRTSIATAREEWGGPHLKDNRDHPDQFRSLGESLRSLPDARQSDRGSSGGSFRGPSDGYQVLYLEKLQYCSWTFFEKLYTRS